MTSYAEVSLPLSGLMQVLDALNMLYCHILSLRSDFSYLFLLSSTGVNGIQI